MPRTFEPIASQTLGSSTATVDLTSIPATFTDLVLVVQGSATGNADVILQYNSDTASNYSQTVLRGNGTTASSVRYTTQYLNSADVWGSGRIYTHIIQLMSYANTNVFKTALIAGAWAGGDINRTVNLWRSTSAITSIQVKATGGASFASGTTFSLFGVKAA